MKTLLFIFLNIFILFNINIINADNNSTPEESCFELLNDRVGKDVRFSNLKDTLKDGDLSNVLYDEQAGSYIDLSSHKNFLDYRVKNRAWNGTNGGNITIGTKTRQRSHFGLLETDFVSRRNNIATVIADSNYIITEVVGFGRDSNFDFPVESKLNPFGDKYELSGRWFKEFVLYTHYSIAGDFLSCGLFHLTPLNKRSYGDVPETAYFTNTLQGNENQSILGNRKCSSGFEGEYLKKDGKDFYKMKTDVCALDYAQNDFVKMEILTIAYDNGSDYFNEYEVFPLQVEAMKNTDTTSGGLLSIMDEFQRLLHNKTCLKLIHTTLPSRCGETSYENTTNFKKVVYNKVNYFINKIIPTTFASRSFNISQEEIEESRGMVVFDGFPYELYDKLNQIENKTFVEYIKLALTPNLEDFIKYRVQNDIVISPFEEVFLGCGIDYKERNEIIIDFIKNLDLDNFSTANLIYSNPKFGDCIVPYPDKRNINKVIEGSFNSNQLLAQKLTGEYIPADIHEDIIKMIEEENKISNEHQKSIDELTREFNEGKITGEELKQKVEEITKKYEENINKIRGEIQKINLKTLDNAGFINSTQKESNTNFYIIIGILLFIGSTIILVGIYKNKK